MGGASACPVIAIDGPGAVGKGMVCAMLHRWLGWQVLDSGLLYRAAALAVQDAGLVAATAPPRQVLAAVTAMDCSLKVGGDGAVMLLFAGRDRTGEARAEQVASAASRLATIPELRAILLPRQRSYRRPPGLIADGRDMGTVVFPEAALKIFMGADPRVRTERRYNQLKNMGIGVSMGNLDKDIRDRDSCDSGRFTAPLRIADEALFIDTTTMDKLQVLQRVAEAVAPVAAKQPPQHDLLQKFAGVGQP